MIWGRQDYRISEDYMANLENPVILSVKVLYPDSTAVVRLRDLERSLANTRQMNKAQRAAKQIKLKIKTR